MFVRNAAVPVIPTLLAALGSSGLQAQTWEPRQICSNRIISVAESVPRNVPRLAGYSHCQAALDKAKRVWQRQAIPAVVDAARNQLGLGRVATSPPASFNDATLQAIVVNGSVRRAPGSTGRCWRKFMRQKHSIQARACGTVHVRR